MWKELTSSSSVSVVMLSARCTVGQEMTGLEEHAEVMNARQGREHLYGPKRKEW